MAAVGCRFDVVGSCASPSVSSRRCWEEIVMFIRSIKGGREKDLDLISDAFGDLIYFVIYYFFIL